MEFTENQISQLISGDTVCVYGVKGQIGKKRILLNKGIKYNYECTSWYSSVPYCYTSTYKLTETKDHESQEAS